MFRRILFIISIFISAHVLAQSPDFKLYLVGDAGEDEITGETLDSLKSKLLHNPESAIIFLGDNCYKNTLFGLIEGFKGFDSSKITRLKLHSQLDILNAYKGSVFFVPGNHDWWNITSYNKGKRKLKMEESFIESNLGKNTTIANPGGTFFPKDGSPGPASVELDNKKVRIVFIDTYWLILLGFKKNPAENFAIANTFYHNLDSTLALATIQHQKIVVVAHHPSYYTIDAVSKSSPPFRNDLKHPYFFGRIKQSSLLFPSYDTMAVKLNSIFQKYPRMYYATGHIHALQFHTYKGVNYIISGAGSKTIKVKEKPKDTSNKANADCELWNEKGFFEMDFYKDLTPGVILYNNSGRVATQIKTQESLK